MRKEQMRLRKTNLSKSEVKSSQLLPICQSQGTFSSSLCSMMALRHKQADYKSQHFLHMQSGRYAVSTRKVPPGRKFIFKSCGRSNGSSVLHNPLIHSSYSPVTVFAVCYNSESFIHFHSGKSSNNSSCVEEFLKCFSTITFPAINVRKKRLSALWFG